MSTLAATARTAETAKPLSPARLFWRRFRQHRGALLAGAVLLAMGLAALAAPLIAAWLGTDPEAVDLLALTQPPGPGHPLGTDELGRDVLVRLLYGGRVSLFGWTTAARLVRGATLSLKQQDFVRAAAALGVPARRIMWRHIVPNALSPVIVATTLSVGNIILFESVLSFLGLGVQPPLASWGNMLTNAQDLIWNAPWLAIWPGLAIFVTVIAFNFLGDGLQDALDPRALNRRSS